jgi:hypothetical protein
MKKRIYSMPLVEVANIHFSGALLSSPTPPTTPTPPLGPGYTPRRRVGVQVF